MLVTGGIRREIGNCPYVPVMLKRGAFFTGRGRAPSQGGLLAAVLAVMVVGCSGPCVASLLQHRFAAIPADDQPFEPQVARMKQAARREELDYATLWVARVTADALRWPPSAHLSRRVVASGRVRVLRSDATRDTRWLLRADLLPDDLSARLLPVNGALPGPDAYGRLFESKVVHPYPGGASHAPEFIPPKLTAQQVFSYVAQHEVKPELGYDAFLTRYRVGDHLVQIQVTEEQVIASIRSTRWHHTVRGPSERPVSVLKQVLNPRFDPERFVWNSGWFPPGANRSWDGQILRYVTFPTVKGKMWLGRRIRIWYDGTALQLALDRYDYPWGAPPFKVARPPGAHLNPTRWFEGG